MFLQTVDRVEQVDNLKMLLQLSSEANLGRWVIEANLGRWVIEANLGRWVIEANLGR